MMFRRVDVVFSDTDSTNSGNMKKIRTVTRREWPGTM